MILIVSKERKGDVMRQDVLNEINIFLRGGKKETTTSPYLIKKLFKKLYKTEKLMI